MKILNLYLEGKREMFCLKKNNQQLPVLERKVGNLREQVILLEGCLTAVIVLGLNRNDMKITMITT